MRQLQQLSIPQPCHQNWQQMTPVEQGRHCESCCKTVIDFTGMSSDEILAYLNTNGKTCGKFAPSQLAALNNTPANQTISRFSWNGFIAAASIITLIPNTKAQAKQVYKTEQGPLLREKNNEITATDSLLMVVLKGKIIDKDDKLPLPGVTVRIKGSNDGVLTSVDGTFTLRGNLLSKTIVISYIGYQNTDIVINSPQPIEIALEQSHMMMGEVVVVARHVPFYKRWWHKVKRIF